MNSVGPRSFFDRVGRVSTREAQGDRNGSAPVFIDLFAEDGALARDTTPAAVVSDDGGVIASNAAFDRIRALLEADGLAVRFGDTVASATTRCDTVALTGGDGAKTVWRLTVLPLAGGGSALVQAHDATPDQVFNDALVESRQRYKDLVEISSDFV